MTNATLFYGGRHDSDITPLLQFFVERMQAGGVNTIIIDQQDLHGTNSLKQNERGESMTDESTFGYHTRTGATSFAASNIRRKRMLFLTTKTVKRH
jgi:hypothetical protein